jgi:hypothetical protein
VARRLPSAPPTLPGFSYLHVLGSGGFADVFLYEQNMPRRQVAVKVLLAEAVNDQARVLFQAEANLMAQLSAHPSILTVFQAGVSADGRPYLVMEFCSSAIGAHYRAKPLSVADALRIGVRIGSAVETAHRSGVLHRDIKPSNILLTAYGHPVLSDFGIASTLGAVDTHAGVGMSVPWSAPEVLADDTPGTVRSEVWSLAATVYSLLAGRSPFEIPAGANTSSDLITRISKARAQPIGRPDVPDALEELLIGAMARKPENRPGSALELVHALQAIETQLGLAQTPAEVAVDEWALGTVSDVDDRTQVRAAVAPGPVPRSRRRRDRGSGAAVTGWQGSEVAPAVSSGTVQAAAPSRRMTMMAWAIVSAAVLLIAVGATVTVIVVRAAGAATIPTVSDIQASSSGGSVEFSWDDPGLTSRDSYRIATSDGDTSIQRSTTFVVDASAGSRMCLTVTVSRDGKSGSPSGEKCVDVSE